MHSKISCLFLDIGGVLLSDGWGHGPRQHAAHRFDIDFVKMEEMHALLFPLYEIGKISLDDYLEQVVFSEPRNFEKLEFKNFMFAQSFQLPEMYEWVVEWKRQHPQVRIAAVNNEGKELNDYRIRKFHLHACFDAFISSCDVGLRKPDPEIFRLALAVMHVDPESCLYFDDRKVLADAARNTGLRAYHHLGLQTTKDIIEQAGIF